LSARSTLAVVCADVFVPRIKERARSVWMIS
jgi:hypothetical protein